MASRPRLSSSARAVAAVAALLCAALPARADIGVPMLAVVWPVSWVLLIPIVGLEAWIARRMLRTALKDSIKAAGWANAVSTIVGIPATWVALVMIEAVIPRGGAAWGLDTPSQRLAAVTLQAPWLIPYEHDLGWMIPAAALVLCVPFYLMSVPVEALVARAVLKDVPQRDTWRWAWKANAASYGLIVILIVIDLLLNLAARGSGGR